MSGQEVEKEGNAEQPTSACSAFFVPADVVHAWRRNQKVEELDRPADKQLTTQLLDMEKALERNTLPPPDKQRLVARKLGNFLTSKKTRDVSNAIAPTAGVSEATASGAVSGAVSKDERLLAEVPMSYRGKAKKLMRAWHERGMTWDRVGRVYLKGKPVKGASLVQLLHHASSGRRGAPPTGYGRVRSHMADEFLPPTAYANPRWRVGQGDNYNSSESTTEYYTQSEGEGEKETNITRGSFPEWQHLSDSRDGSQERL